MRRGGCHLDDDDGADGGCAGAAPAAGLSLCAAEAWAALVDVPSRQTDALRLVEPGDSARSYLLRKLLPATADGGPIAGVVGQREPPGAPLPEDRAAGGGRLDRRRRARVRLPRLSAISAPEIALDQA